MDQEQRPSAGAVLENTRQSSRGQLKLFLGAAPGVGKTYAMLTEAHEMRKTGLDVVIGWVDTHGRKDTEKLLEGLEVIPRRRYKVNGHRYEELDIQAIIKRRPATVVIDEMPHSNGPECTHYKRWQDIDEILDLGINVFSALNIQHLESLNDIVAKVTGVWVRETIPDSIFDKANEVRLVDLPPDDLIARLNAGKIYLPHIVGNARANYFKKGNLIALREMTLRYMANRVDMQAKLQRLINLGGDHSTNYGLLLLIENVTGKEAIREASRLAKSMSVQWHCVYIDSQFFTEEREEISDLLVFAKSLGAQTEVLTGDYPYCIKDYARSNNLNILLLLPQSKRVFTRRYAQIAALDPNMAVIALPYSVKVHTLKDKVRSFFRRQMENINGYVATSVLTGVVTAAAVPLSRFLSQTNIVMLYLMITLFVSVRYGIFVASFSSLLSVLVFDLTMVSPVGSFRVHDLEYLITFASILIVGLVTARLVTHSRTMSQQARIKARQTGILYDAARVLSSTVDDMEVFTLVCNILKRHLNVNAEFWKCADEDQDEPQRIRATIKNVDRGMINFVITHKKEAGFGTNTLAKSRYLYLPVIVNGNAYAVLVLDLEHETQWTDKSSSKVLQALVSLTVQTLERLVSEDEAKQILMDMEAEKLRHSLIQALSHDLKTPLTAIQTNAELLYKKLKDHNYASAADEAGDIVDSTSRMVKLMSNLLEMAKLQSGELVLNKEWLPANEIIGSSLRNLKDLTGNFNIKVRVDDDCPCFYADPVLIDRLLTNLLDNAMKFCPHGSTIEVAARARGDKITLAVNDSGPGFGEINPQRLFDPFKRGVKESKTFGIGLGLAICKTIARAHDADLLALDSPLGGASFVLVMPLVELPEEVMDDEEDAGAEQEGDGDGGRRSEMRSEEKAEAKTEEASGGALRDGAEDGDRDADRKDAGQDKAESADGDRADGAASHAARSAEDRSEKDPGASRESAEKRPADRA